MRDMELSRRDCPFCSKEESSVEMMLIDEDLPEFLGVNNIVEDYSIPFLGSWINSFLKKALKEVRKKILTYKCPKCGFIAFFKV